MRTSLPRVLKLGTCFLVVVAFILSAKQLVQKIETTIRQPSGDLYTGFTVRHVEFGAGLNKQFKAQAANPIEPKTHLVLLRVNEIGSSILENIMFQFGMRHNLSFAHFTQDNTLSKNESFPHLSEGVRYDLASIRYDDDEVAELIHPDVVKITILKDPIAEIDEDILDTVVAGGNAALYSNDLTVDLKTYFKRPNLLAKVLGFHHGTPLDMKEDMSTLLTKIEKEFGLVLMLAHLEESVILLRKKLGWSYSDILYLEREIKNSNGHLSGDERQIITEANQLDVAVYGHFAKVYDEQVYALGEDFDEEVVNFKIILNQFNGYCTQRAVPTEPLILEGCRWYSTIVITWTDCEKIKMLKSDFIKTRSPGKGTTKQ